jgi:hypothetical protein
MIAMDKEVLAAVETIVKAGNAFRLQGAEVVGVPAGRVTASTDRRNLRTARAHTWEGQ